MSLADDLAREFGPKHAGLPPPCLVDELAELINQHADVPPRHVAIAYGLGWRRGALSGNADWDEMWPPAWDEVVEASRRFILRAWKALRQDVEGFRRATIGRCGLVRELAALFAAVFREKYLVHWDPGQGHLYAFLREPVIGGKLSRKGHLFVNKFNQSLLFAELHAEVELDDKSAARMKCLECPLRHEDILNWDVLCGTIYGDGMTGANTPAGRIWHYWLGAAPLAADALRRKALSHTLTSQDKDAIVDGLNAVLAWVDFFDDHAFQNKKAKLTEEAHQLLAASPSALRDDEVKRVNWLLLAGAFPSVIHPQPKTLYSPQRCDRCGAAYTPDTRWITWEPWLIIDYLWEERPFWHCNAALTDCQHPRCSNNAGQPGKTCPEKKKENCRWLRGKDGYFDCLLSACPHCGKPNPQRRTSLWVRRGLGLAGGNAPEQNPDDLPREEDILNEMGMSVRGWTSRPQRAVLHDLKQIVQRLRFTDEDAGYVEGDRVTVYAHPWRRKDGRIDAVLTILEQGKPARDLEGQEVVLCREGNEVGRAKVNRRGQVWFGKVEPGAYRAFLGAHKKGRVLKIADRLRDRMASMVLAVKQSPRWAAAAAVLLALLVAGWTVAYPALQRLATLRQEIAERQAEYDRAWAALRFEDIIQPVIRAVPAEPRGELNRVRVELSPRVEEGLVRDVSVSWGDAGDVWEPMYEAKGTLKRLQVTHDYPLPPPGQTRSWTLRVQFIVADAVAAARSLTPDELTYRCRVEATSDGIRLAPVTPGTGRRPLIASARLPEVNWAEPAPGERTGWQTRVTLVAKEPTERVTVLVRPVLGTTYYVVGGARRLVANVPESFEVQLGDSRSGQVGEEFEVVAVCSDTFRPSRPQVAVSDLPGELVAARLEVRKAAAEIRLSGPAAEGRVRVEGSIWTTYGGVLLTYDGRQFKVVYVFAPSPVGQVFSEAVEVPEAEPETVYLLVCRQGAAPPQVGDTMAVVPADSYWLYGPAGAGR